MDGLRSLRAENPGPFTLDGTRSWIVGSVDVAIVDIGPAVEPHLRAVAAAVRDAERVTLLLTHGHPDHAGGVDAFRKLRPDARVVGAGHPAADPLPAGERIATDAGDLVCLPTPGHTRDHLAFHHPERRTLFCGDLLLGEGETTWVAEYPGCVADYLTSLDRVEALDLATIHPAHGPVIDSPRATIDRYAAHREARIAEVRAARARWPSAGFDRIYDEVYASTVPEELRGAAEASLRALLHHVDTDAGSA
ncbi:MAG: MBL fold metallo-hydrolase [Longimicrobiales bacterium]|nr:MBL fold metallo-hydrolase [Longimicrobiales bacterium]